MVAGNRTWCQGWGEVSERQAALGWLSVAFLRAPCEQRCCPVCLLGEWASEQISSLLERQ